MRNEIQYEAMEEQSNAGKAMMDDLRAIFDEPDADVKRLSRRLYKITNCGAWLTVDVAGLTLGSIVEGADIDCASHTLSWERYLSMEDGELERWLDSVVKEIEDEAEYIWQQTHGCDDCNVEGEWGHDAINPACTICGGNGVI